MESVTATLSSAKPYTARLEADGTYSILDVEVWSTLPAGTHGGNPEIDSKFLDDVLLRHRMRRAEGYSPPIHVQHHGDGGNVERAGEFRLKRVAAVDYEGVPRPTLIADFIRVPKSVFRRIEAGEIPYRSVEVSYGPREVESIALLSHDAPYFKFRNLSVSLTEPGCAGFAAVSDGVGLFAFCPNQEHSMPKPDTADEVTFVTAKSLEDALAKQAETMTATFSAKMDEVLAKFSAVAPYASKVHHGWVPDASAETDAEGSADAETATETDDVEMAKLEGRFAALERRFAEKDDAEKATADADEMIAKFRSDGFHVSEEHVAKFHEIAVKGADALAAYAEGFAEKPKDPPATLGALAAHAATQDDAVIGKYAAQGPTALTEARKADAMFQAQKGRGMKCSRERFIEMQVENARKGEE